MVALSQNWTRSTQRPHSAQIIRQTPHQRKPTSSTPTRMVLRARYYDPATSEFTSPDPLEYVDGMSCFRGYFVGVGIDPSGKDIVVYPIGQDIVVYPIGQDPRPIQDGLPPRYPFAPELPPYIPRPAEPVGKTWCAICICTFAGRTDQESKIKTTCRASEDGDACCKLTCPGSRWKRLTGDNSPEYSGNWTECVEDEVPPELSDCLDKCKADELECIRKVREDAIMTAKDCAAYRNPWMAAACEFAGVGQYFLAMEVCSIDAKSCRENCCPKTVPKPN